MSLVLQSSSGGQITIQEPATASNFTQTLPASTGTVITTGTPQSGSVLQVVSAVSTTQTSTSSTSFVNVGALSASITPKFATSKILIIINTTTQTTNTLYTSIARNTTELSSNVGMVVSSVPSNYYTPTSLSYLDSPATTSATTYYMQGKVSSGTGYWNVQFSTITLLEIAA